MNVEEADFVYLKEKTESTAGNLSVQLDKLSTAGYIAVEKGLSGKRPRTVCSITAEGREAFEDYVETPQAVITVYKRNQRTIARPKNKVY